MNVIIDTVSGKTDYPKESIAEEATCQSAEVLPIFLFPTLSRFPCGWSGPSSCRRVSIFFVHAALMFGNQLSYLEHQSPPVSQTHQVTVTWAVYLSISTFTHDNNAVKSWIGLHWNVIQMKQRGHTCRNSWIDRQAILSLQLNSNSSSLHEIPRVGLHRLPE